MNAMDRHTMYFRLSLIWLALLAAAFTYLLYVAT
jgi:hypothetical protein